MAQNLMSEPVQPAGDWTADDDVLFERIDHLRHGHVLRGIMNAGSRLRFF
ncbi:hypothetical protein [Nocardia aurea]|nr:hypothetical protein [Nocardia aurea]